MGMSVQNSQINADVQIQMNNVGGSTKIATQVSAGMIEKSSNGFKVADSFSANASAIKTGNLTKKAGLEAAGDCKIKLSAEHQGKLGGVASEIRGGNLEEANAKFSSFISDIHANGMPVDVNALVQEVLRESYVDTTQDLQFYAEKVKYFNEAKKMTREYTQELRDFKTGLSKACQDKGWCLSNPPTEDPAKTQFNDFVKEYCIKNTKVAGHASGSVTNNYDVMVGMINDIAIRMGADQAIGRANEKLSSEFGVSEMPEQLSKMISDAFVDGDDAKINDAMSQFAAFVTYLADSACENGKFPGYGHYGTQNHNYDDFKHLDNTTTPSWEDFQHCMYTSTDPQNIRSRTNLNPGDVDAINRAFGFDSSVGISGSTGFTSVVATAMSPLHDAWKNEILVNVSKNTADLRNDVLNGNCELAKQYPDLCNIELLVDNTENSQMAKDIGIPSTVPGSDITTVDELDNAIKSMEEKLSTIGDDAQLANTDLQNVLQKQQQTLQMMSNISKMLSDTALAIIRKIG